MQAAASSEATCGVLGRSFEGGHRGCGGRYCKGTSLTLWHLSLLKKQERNVRTFHRAVPCPLMEGPVLEIFFTGGRRGSSRRGGCRRGSSSAATPTEEGAGEVDDKGQAKELERTIQGSQPGQATTTTTTTTTNRYCFIPAFPDFVILCENHFVRFSSRIAGPLGFVSCVSAAAKAPSKRKPAEEDLADDPAYDDLYGTEDNVPTVSLDITQETTITVLCERRPHGSPKIGLVAAVCGPRETLTVTTSLSCGAGLSKGRERLMQSLMTADLDLGE